MLWISRTPARYNNKLSITYHNAFVSRSTCDFARSPEKPQWPKLEAQAREERPVPSRPAGLASSIAQTANTTGQARTTHSVVSMKCSGNTLQSARFLLAYSRENLASRGWVGFVRTSYATDSTDSLRVAEGVTQSRQNPGTPRISEPIYPYS